MMFFNETLVLEEWRSNKTRMSKRGAISLIDKMSLQRIYNTTCTAEKEIRSDEETRQATDFRSQCHKENVRGNKLRKLFRRLGTGLANASEKLSPCRDTGQFYSVYRAGKKFPWRATSWRSFVMTAVAVPRERSVGRFEERRTTNLTACGTSIWDYTWKVFANPARRKTSSISLNKVGKGVKWIVLVLPINYNTIFLTGHFLTFEIIRFEDKRKITNVWV